MARQASKTLEKQTIYLFDRFRTRELRISCISIDPTLSVIALEVWEKKDRFSTATPVTTAINRRIYRLVHDGR
jgi:hypothetical protein